MHTTDPARVGRYWLFADGTVLPVISGGDGEEGNQGGAPGGGSGGDGGQGGDAGQQSKFSFSQADVDRIVQDRLARAKAQPPADYDDLKAKAARFDELAAANKSELEKAVERAKADADKAGRQDERSKADARIVRAEVKAAAGTKLADPEDAVRLLDLGQFKVDDDGEVDGKAIAQAIDDLVKTKPYLAASSGDGKNGKNGLSNLGQGKRDGTAAPSTATGKDLWQARHAKT